VTPDSRLAQQLAESLVHAVRTIATVATVATAAEALDAARSDPPHLVLMASPLPDQSGTEVCRQLRAASTTSTAVLVLIGRSLNEADATAAGADGCVQPPADARAWPARLAVYLRLAETVAELAVERETRRGQEMGSDFRQVVLDGLPAQVCVLDSAGKIVAVNQQWRDFAAGNGWVAADAGMGMNYLAVCDASVGEGAAEARALAQDLRHLLAGETKNVVAEYACHSPSRRRWFTLHAVPLRGESPGKAVVVHMNVTAQKEVERALRISESRYRLLADHTEDFVTLFDTDWNRLYNSPAYHRRTGWTPRDLDEADYRSRMHPDDLPGIERARAAATAGELATFEHRIRCKDGSWMWVEAVGKQVASPGGSRQVLISAHEITVRKEMELALSFLLHCGLPGTGEDFFASLARYLARTLDMEYVCIDRLEGDGLNAMPVAVYNAGRFDENIPYALKDTPCGAVVERRVCCFPEEVCRLFPNDAALRGLRAESYVGITLWDSRGKPNGLIAVVGQRRLANPHRAESLLNLVATRAGGELERRAAEDILRESQARLTQALEAAEMGVWDWDMTSDRTRWQGHHERLWGYAPGEFPGTRAAFESRVHPDDLPGLRTTGEDTIRSRQPFRAEYRVVWPDGSVHWVCSHGQPYFDAEGKPVRMRGVAFDITERRAAAERAGWLRDLGFALAGAADLPSALRSCLDTAIKIGGMDSGGIYIVDEQTGVHKLACHTGVSPAFVAAFGEFPADGLPTVWAREQRPFHGHQGMIEHAGLDPAILEPLQALSIVPILHEGHRVAMLIVASHSEPEVPMAARSALETVAGMLGGVIESLRIKAALATSLDQMRSLLASMDDMVFVLDRQLTFRECHQPAASRLLMPPEQFLGRRVDQIGFPEPAQGLMLGAVRRTLETGTPSQVEYFLETPVGGGWFDLHVTRLTDAKGESRGVTCVVRDVTPLKQTETALSESEERFRLFMRHSPTIAWIKDEDGRHIFLSETYEKRFGVRLADWRGKTDAELWPPEVAAQFRHNDLAVLASNQAIQVTEQTANPDGSLCHWLNSKFAFADSTGRRYVAGIGIDITERKAAEEELRRWSVDLRQRVEARTKEISDLYNNAPCGYHSLGPDGTVLQMNDTELNWLGYSRAEVEGRMRLWDFMPPDTQERFHQRFAEFQQQSGWMTNEWEVRSRGGETRCLLVNSEVVRDGQGNFLRSRSTALEITEHKRLERIVAESEDRLRRLFDSSRDAIVLIDTNGRCLDCNPAAVQMYGAADRAEVLARGPMGLTPERQPNGDLSGPAFAAHLAAAIAKGSHQCEWWHQRKDGTVFPTEVSISFVDIGGERVIQGTLRDVSERRAFIDRLQESGQRLRDIINTVPGWVWEIDEHFRYSFCSPQCRALLGYEPDDLIGRNPLDLCPPDEAMRLEKIFQPLVTQRLPLVAVENTMLHKDGRRVTVETDAVPAFDAAGNFRGYRGLDHDVTERKRMRVELERALDAAQAGNRAKALFLASMSHELRTPMNSVLGFTRLVMEDPAINARSRDRLGTVMRSGEHLLAVINDVLDAARLETGSVTLSPAPFDLRELVDDVRRMIALRAQPREVRFLVERTSDLPRGLVGDATKLRQIFINLLGNSVKFTPAGGEVRLRLGIAALPPDRVRLEAEVADTGVGIDAAQLARLGEPFFQTPTGRAVGGGTGLGLAITRGLIRLMGGEFHVTSQLGMGTCVAFDVVLTVATGTEIGGVTGPRALRLLPAYEGCRVLVVDDRFENCELLMHILQPLGFAVRQVADGAGALAQCAEWQPRVVLLDLVMPGMDGFEIAVRIRETHGPDMKIIAISAADQSSFEPRARAAGVDAYLPKPLREEALLPLLRQLAGVEYIHADRAEDTAQHAPDAESPMTDALKTLPRELVAALLDATCRADYDELLDLTEEARKRDGRLADQLKRLVAAFDYVTLRRVLTAADPADPK
jgi:PAS domain S-box-containing protein